MRFEAATAGDTPPLAGTHARILDIAPGNVVELTDGNAITDADYLRVGDDLVLHMPDGETLVVKGYFGLADPPDLVSADGGRMTPGMVEAFAQADEPVEVAQAGAAPPPGAVGIVEILDGTATVARPDGTVVDLTEGAPIYANDVVETGPDGAVRLLFTDDSVFAVGPNAELAIDEYVFDVIEGEGLSAWSVLEGTFAFVSGQIADNDPNDVSLTTPVAVIGIRGTFLLGDIVPPGSLSHLTIVEDASDVANDGGAVALDERFETTTVFDFAVAPTEPVILSYDEVIGFYGPVQGMVPEFLAPEAGAPGDGASDGGTSQFTFLELAEPLVAGDRVGAEGTEGAPGSPPPPPIETDVPPPTESAPSEDMGGAAPGQQPPPPPPPPMVFDRTFQGGDGEENVLFLGELDDSMDGGGGDDTFFAGGGNDLVIGGLGDDTLSGGTGMDTMRGGAGEDEMTGGDDADVFDWSLLDIDFDGDGLVDGIDDVTDYSGAGDGDTLDITQLLDDISNLGALFRAQEAPADPATVELQVDFSGTGAAYQTFAEVHSGDGLLGAALLNDVEAGLVGPVIVT